MRVVWHALRISEVLLLMHSSRCHSGATVLCVRRALRARRVEWRSLAAAHLRHRAERLWRMVGHVRVVLTLRRESTTAASVGVRAAAAHVCVAHVAVRRLGGFATHVLRHRVRVWLRGHSRACLWWGQYVKRKEDYMGGRAQTHVRLSAFTALATEHNVWPSGQSVGLGASRNRRRNGRW